MASVEQIIDGREIVICAGSGGVGKTTTSAAIALGMAARGHKVCVLTIDPAKRLADSLGLKELGNEASKVNPKLLKEQGVDPENGGELWAMMLDAKETFDALVARHAEDAEARDRVLNNRIYQQISGALAGSQEYMAMEKLFELHSEGRFDLLVLDTPPSRNALDFLDAPQRLTQFIEGKSLQIFIRPTGLAARVASRGTGVALSVLKRIVGFDLLADLSEFFTAFSGMIDGFQDRAHRVSSLLADERTSFLIICGPQSEPIDEAVFFHSKLVENRMNFGGAVVNRVRYRLGSHQVKVKDLSGRIDRELDDTALAERLARNLAEYDVLAVRDQKNIDELTRALNGEPVIRIPYLDTDVHDIAGLCQINEYLFVEEDERVERAIS
ncbi:MAG TPA: ArsA-related P-loop ATPase [Solirubrobacterales bacterium]|nr:ArsA-related P-loop ATPase [Solirubrobacterales bacterium]HNA45429.1 ArsA-related P-loop ATPase [Solirubrobacterales bacterium]HNF84861.1 ArsA-related P-loop ATPase [Solirubrobacterales bacterium]HNO98046.1 ArsA-related P-loop ATPase [Solirubrobacterales bacterium]